MSEINEPITEPQQLALGRLFAQPYVDHGVTKDDFQERVQTDPEFAQLLQLNGGYVRRFVARRDAVSPYLLVNELPQYHTKANNALVYDWSRRGSEDVRLELVARALIGAGLGITDVVLTDSVVAMPAWQSCLVVSPIDLLRQQGIDPEKVEPKQYCRLVKPLCHALPGVQVGVYLDGCISGNGAQLEAETLAAWLTLPTTQEKGAPLIVRRMAVNPAVWFDHNGTIYNFAPLHTPSVFATLPTTNKVKRVLPGDLIVATSLYLGEPHLIDQIMAGTCPRSDIPGTETRCDGQWSDRPYLSRYDGEAWLDYSYYAGDASEGFGSIGCAWE